MEDFKKLLFLAAAEGLWVQGRKKDGSRFSGKPEIWRERSEKVAPTPEHPNYGKRWLIGYGRVDLEEIAEIALKEDSKG